MKGPYERIKYELRRLFECPACQRREWTLGDRTYCLCPCEGAPQPMKMLEDGVRRVLPIPPGPTKATSDG